MMAPKKIVPAGGALWRRKTWSDSSSSAKAPIVLTAFTPTRAGPSVRRDRSRNQVTTGELASVLSTGSAREDGEVASPLAELVALAVVGRQVGARLAVDGRHRRATPPHLARVL